MSSSLSAAKRRKVVSEYMDQHRLNIIEYDTFGQSDIRLFEKKQIIHFICNNAKYLYDVITNKRVEIESKNDELVCKDDTNEDVKVDSKKELELKHKDILKYYDFNRAEMVISGKKLNICFDYCTGKNIPIFDMTANNHIKYLIARCLIKANHSVYDGYYMTFNTLKYIMFYLELSHNDISVLPCINHGYIYNNIQYLFIKYKKYLTDVHSYILSNDGDVNNLINEYRSNIIVCKANENNLSDYLIACDIVLMHRLWCRCLRTSKVKTYSTKYYNLFK